MVRFPRAIYNLLNIMAINKIKLHHGDNKDILKSMEDNSIDLIITSPPYKDRDGFSYAFMRDVFRELYRVQKENTLFFLNFGALAEDKFRPYATCKIAMDCGFKLNDTIVWVKNHYKPIQGKRRVNNLTEFIFVLYKGKMPLLNRLAIGVPYVDKTNANRFNKGLDLHCAGNVWYINYETINSSEEKLHNDRFPEELPNRCIKLSGLKDGTVIDPFSGSGTVGVSAKKHGLNYIGIEKNIEHFETSKKRLGI